MVKKINQRSVQLLLSYFIVWSLNTNSVLGQQISKTNTDTSVYVKKDFKDIENEMMLPIAFFTRMGVPLSVGTCGLRVSTLPTQNEGETNTEFNFQFETGLSKTVGFFLGGEGLFDDPALEIMFQFLVLKSENGMNGFTPIIEFEFPLGKEIARRVYTSVGFATTLSNYRLSFNQALHYSPLEDLAKGNVSLVVKVSKRIFFISEILGVAEKGSRPIFNLLGGVKVKVNKNFLLGFAFQLPLTENRDYSSQFVYQTNAVFQK